MIPDWLLKTPVYESLYLKPQRERRVRREWIERYRDNTGKVRHIFHHDLRQHGSAIVTVKEPAAAFLINFGYGPVIMGPPGILNIVTS